MADVESVRVALRIRPLVRSEIERGCQEAVEHMRGAHQVVVSRSDNFTFNYVFDAHDTQQFVYEECVSEVLDKLFLGFNGTILAYGQTGSGKTYTMGTAFDGDINENAGVIPRAMSDIFKRISELSNEFDFVVTCSFMELYQEQLYDLLSTQAREQSVVDLRENRNGIVMPGLTEQVVHSALETTNCLMRGSSGRAVAATAMNQQSSRSHAIFTVTIQATKKDELKTVTTSKFHLVDLAGSERSKKTMTTGDRFKEGVKINQGLLALGNVISALGSGQGSGFVRYRDSKLTRLLQDSLGGNSITLMIACVSPADYNVAETLSTLRYADRARQIKNKPIVNQDPHAAEINHLKSIIQELRGQLLAAGRGDGCLLGGSVEQVAMELGKPMPRNDVQQSDSYQLKEKYKNLQQQLQTTLHDVAENEMRAHIAEAAHEKLKAETDEIKAIVAELARDLTPDADADLMAENIKRVQQIQELVTGLDEHLAHTQSEILDNKRCCSLNSIIDGSDGEGSHASGVSPEMATYIQEQADAYTSKQIGFKDQLRHINRELNLKEELHLRIAGNLRKFCTLDNNDEQKFQECEAKIKELEAERAELLDKLRHVKERNASAKIAEERRKRLQTLEQEISDMKRKNLQQSKMLKVREKDTAKIKVLSQEIQAMKESKVKLIRAMRQESENFRQWKLAREKEVMQLKNKDRKMQNEMVRKDALHEKQRNVLKRKCEEAMAINKRLKDAIDRQKIAQSQRHKTQSSKDSNATAANKINNVVSLVERELEVIISLIDAEHSLKQLIEGRGIINSRIQELQGQQSQAERDTELATLTEDLEMRNIQISDLQQKVSAADLAARMSSLHDNIQSIAEARVVLKQLIQSISEMRREHSNQKNTIDELVALRDAEKERCDAAAKRMRLMKLEFEDDMAERENTYEEKIAVLLRELHKAPQPASDNETTSEQTECFKIQEEQLNKVDELREELVYYKSLVSQLRKGRKTKQEQKAEPQADGYESDGNTLELSEDEDDDDDSVERDPDWKKPSFFKTPKAVLKRRTTKSDSSAVSIPMDETYVTAVNADSESFENKRKSKKCKCRSNCRSKRCGCRALDERCSANCRCSSSCVNGKNDKDTLECGEPERRRIKLDDDSEENDSSVNKTADEDEPRASEISGNRLSKTSKRENTEELDTTSGARALGSNNDDKTTILQDNNSNITNATSLVTPKNAKSTSARVSTLIFESASAKRKFFN